MGHIDELAIRIYFVLDFKPGRSRLSPGVKSPRLEAGLILFRRTTGKLCRISCGSLDENYDENGAQRQLYGFSIAAKRYALYTTECGQPYCSHRECLTIVDPKAHGLIFFAPSEERENGLPKWWWELWRFLLAVEFKQLDDPDSNVLMVAGRAIDAETAADIDGLASWIALPAMMKMRISTPHYMDQMKGKASPFGFVLHPRTRDKLKLTLLTPFSKKREGWAHSLCINTHDGQLFIVWKLAAQ
jgi:hypothetical protein